MNGIYARLNTSKGTILIELTYQQTPGTVANFVGLAEGTQKNEHKKEGTPYYDGLIFHRVIADFMIQGGCPQGSGVGGPGYQFDDEFHPELKHDRAGTLSMANAGPATNGSQFFITHGPTAWLDGKHTVFGYVVEGQEVVDLVAQGDSIESLTIERHGKEAEAWNATEAFHAFISSGEERKKATEKAAQEALSKLTTGMEKTASGLFYKITKAGEGAQPEKGAEVTVHYKGTLVDGTVFDSSYQRKEPIKFSVGVGQVIPGWDEGILHLNKGAAARFVIPSQLAYGAQGAGGVIPPHATLVFEVELVDY
ncbi:MAG: peptidylprolyl isomerase [Flavobacteriaceae bacterium]